MDVPEDILQEQHYYPFGMNSNFNWMNDAGLDDTKYLYNGKELNGEFGLEWSDYGARWYDASVAKWWSIDLAAEVTVANSVYNYCYNNPNRFVDPNGMFAVEHKEHEAYSSLKQEMGDIESDSKRDYLMKKAQDFISGNQSPSISINVSNEVKGTANIVDNFYNPSDPEKYNDLVYVISTFKMAVTTCKENEDGTFTETTEEFEVLRYGVKRDGVDGEPYYQGFAAIGKNGKFRYFSETEYYTLGNYNTSDTYKRGYYHLYKQYLLHAGISDPNGEPGETSSGRMNHGCIAVCGPKKWERFNDLLMSACNVDSRYKIPVRTILFTVQPYIPPSTTPVGRKRKG